MGILRRTAPDEDVPTIHVMDVGTIYGKKVEVREPLEGIGVITQGRSASDANLRAARKWFTQADSANFEFLSERQAVDLGSGNIYEVLGSDPLLSDEPRGMCDLFFAADGRLWFLRSTGTTLADREQARVAQEGQLARIETERAKRLGKERQVAIPLSVVYGERMQMSLREAAAKILDAGGEISRGNLGELRITVPARLTGEPLTERVAWAEVGVAAELLERAPRVVLEAVADVESDTSKRPRSLLERLPDREVAFGGGVA